MFRRDVKLKYPVRILFLSSPFVYCLINVAFWCAVCAMYHRIKASKRRREKERKFCTLSSRRHHHHRPTDPTQRMGECDAKRTTENLIASFRSFSWNGEVRKGRRRFWKNSFFSFFSEPKINWTFIVLDGERDEFIAFMCVCVCSRFVRG